VAEVACVGFVVDKVGLRSLVPFLIPQIAAHSLFFILLILTALVKNLLKM
jgi:hypothetical protein